MDSSQDDDPELNAYIERKMANQQRRNDERRNNQKQQRGRDSPGSYNSPQQRYQPPQNEGYVN